MKKQLLTVLLIMAALYQPITSQTTAVTRKVLLTLQPGEKIMYGESCLALSSAKDQVYLVTSIKDKIYVYENGQRRGPYDDLDEAKIQACNNEDNYDNCSIYDTSSEEFDPSLMVPGTDGSYYINLNNKKYGPYGIISHIHVWPDKSGFVTIYMDKEMKLHLATSDGLKLDLNGEVEKIHYSPVGKNFVFALKEKQAIDMDIMKMDFSKMTQEEIMAFAKKQEEKAKNAPELHSYVYVNGTTKLGPFKLNTFYSNNPGYTKTGGNNWIMEEDNTLYINGVKVNTSQNIDLNTCGVWVSTDGKRFVIVSYDKIFFSDSKIYPDPLEPSVIENNGKLMVRWISLENEKDLVSYSREL